MSGLPPTGQWKPDLPPVGSGVDLNGYRFTVTLFGPNVAHACVGCGTATFALPDCPDPRCGQCARVALGVDWSTTQRRELQERFGAHLKRRRS